MNRSDPQKASVAGGTAKIWTFTNAALRSVLRRSAKVIVPIQATGGFIADVVSPLGPIAFYLCLAAIVGAVFCGGAWFGKYRPKMGAGNGSRPATAYELERLASKNWASIGFAFSIVTAISMGALAILQFATNREEQGLLASTVPAVAELQKSIMRIQTEVSAIQTSTAAIKDDTVAIRNDTAHIADSVKSVAEDVETLAHAGGLLPNPSEPQDFYHNARIHEMNGNFGEARKMYLRYFSFGLDVLDPHLSFQAMLKAQEGIEGARESYAYVADKFATLSSGFAQALLTKQEARLKALEQIADQVPDYGPVYYELSREFSEARLGNQTMEDKHAEKDYLTKFVTASNDGHFYKYFVDKHVADEWKRDAEERLAALEDITEAALEKPVSVRFESYGDTGGNAGAKWIMTILPTDLMNTKEIFYSLGDGEFRSTGMSNITQPTTGFAMPNIQVPYVPAPANAQIQIKYTGVDGREHGPYAFEFAAEEAAIEQAKWSAFGNTWLVSMINDKARIVDFGANPALAGTAKQIIYSINGDKLEKTIEIPRDKSEMRNGALTIALPPEAKTVHARIVWANGELSEISVVDLAPDAS